MSEEGLRIWLEVWTPFQGRSGQTGRELDELACEAYNANFLRTPHWFPGARYPLLLEVARDQGWVSDEPDGSWRVRLPLPPEPLGRRQRLSTLAASA